MTGMMASMILVFQTFTLPSKNDLSALSPTVTVRVVDKSSPPRAVTSLKSTKNGKLLLLSDSRNSANLFTDLKQVEIAEVFDKIKQTGRGSGMDEVNENTMKNGESDYEIGLEDDGEAGAGFRLDHEDGVMPERVSNTVTDLFSVDQVFDANNIISLETVRVPGNKSALLSDLYVTTSFAEQIKILGNGTVSLPLTPAPVVPENGAMSSLSVISSSAKDSAEIVASFRGTAKETILNNEVLLPLPSGSAPTNANYSGVIIPLVKKTQLVMPSVCIAEMNQLLLRNRAAHNSMRPRWSTARDKDILAAKALIKNAPVVKNEQELYAPLFRNISMFKRSYGLMERMLKIYVYKDGKKPIFHQPLLKGIYASEGWFMKLMETNKHYVVKDPRRAHLFYMPFSSRYLQLALYVPNSHNMTNLKQHLKNYVDLLARKYSFWNRTGGADHFLVACHDWSPYETRNTMRHSIRALCNSDLISGFQLGKDVSVPETYVRSAQNPLRDLGGRPADQRPTLAFFAGNMHGTLRPVLLHHWENKYPDFKIFGRMPAGVESKMAYIHHMKTSKYCICPRGYEVNSPRVVESIFYECVPVILSDNFVPPFFEVLNWEAFSVILPEKDVPRLKEILESISEEKYQALQMAVRNVQKHFLWHSSPVKYDLFHMILHSIWFNRVYQSRTR